MRLNARARPDAISRLAAAGLTMAAGLLTVAPPLPAQVRISSRAVELEFSGRLQFQLETSSCTDATPSAAAACEEEAPGLDMFLRRARVSLEAAIDDRLSLKLEPDFSDIEEVELKDAWGRYAFGSGLAVQAGYFKRPFDGFQLTSSSQLPFERAIVVPGIRGDALPSYSRLTAAADLSDRDIGVMLTGSPGGGAATWWLAAFTGGSDSEAEDTNTEKQVIGRLQVDFDAGGAPLAVAGALALTDAPYLEADGETEAEYFTNFELWAQLGAWGREGLLIQAGLVGGDNPGLDPMAQPVDLAAGDEFARLLTWQGVAAFRLEVEGTEWLEAVTPFLRVSWADPSELQDDEVLAFTPGLSLYFHGRNRFALSWDVATFAADDVGSESSAKAQMQFYF